MPPMTGRVIAGRYNLQHPIGRGAMGVVWRARDQLLDRDVAVKEVVISALIGADERRNAYQRTLREARTAARLSHPGLVAVYDVAEEDGRPWIVMELVPSQSLDQVLTVERRLSQARACRIGQQLLSALATAHAAGVLHRDVKPSNVLIATSRAGEGWGERAVLTDFGIAQFEGDPRLTQTGMVMGSPGFTAPERIRGSSATPASDLWSLGATIYAAVEGRGPYEQRGGAITTMSAIINEDAPVSPHAGQLAPLIAALLRRDPTRRPSASAALRMFAEALPRLSEAAVEPERRSHPPTIRSSYVTAPGAPQTPAGSATPATTRQPVAAGEADNADNAAEARAAEGARDEARVPAAGKAADEVSAGTGARPAAPDAADAADSAEHSTADGAAGGTTDGEDTGGAAGKAAGEAPSAADDEPDAAVAAADAPEPEHEPAEAEAQEAGLPEAGASEAGASEAGGSEAGSPEADEPEASEAEPADNVATATAELAPAAKAAGGTQADGAPAAPAVSVPPAAVPPAADPAAAPVAAAMLVDAPPAGHDAADRSAETVVPGRGPAGRRAAEVPVPAARVKPLVPPPPKQGPTFTAAKPSERMMPKFSAASPPWPPRQVAPQGYPPAQQGGTTPFHPSGAQYPGPAQPPPDLGLQYPPGAGGGHGGRSGGKARRLLWLVLAVIIAAAVGVGATLALSRDWGSGSAGAAGTAGSPTAVPSVADTTTAFASVNALNNPVSTPPAATWTTYAVSSADAGSAAGGFSIDLPPGWTETRKGLATLFSGPGNMLLEVDLTQQQTTDMVAAAEQVEAASKFRDYNRVSLQAVPVRHAEGAVWKFTWSPTGGVQYMVDDIFFAQQSAAGVQDYAVYVRAPSRTFPVTSRLFDKILSTFQS